jgi:glycosyltransferase involved in cell wall biosynthesis
MTKPAVLMMVQLPPPAHGAALTNARLANSARLRKEFDLRVFPVQLARSVEDSNRFAPSKVLRLGGKAVHLLGQLAVRRPQVALYTIPSKGFAFLAGVVLLGVLRAFSVPYLLQMRCRGIRETGQRSAIHRALCRWTFSKGGVVLNSPYVLADVADFVRNDQVYYVPDGLEDPCPGLCPAARAAHSPPRILFLSHLFEAKGPLVLLEALQLLKRREIPFTATFVGEPGDISAQAFRERIAQMGLSDNVSYPGAAYGDSKAEFLLNTDIFAFPTFYPQEVFPGVLIEAMAYGLPAVTTGEAAIPEIVEDGATGFMTPARDVGALADALERLVTDPDLRRRMAERARKRFLERFQLGQCEDQLAQVLRQAIDSARPSAEALHAAGHP